MTAVALRRGYVTFGCAPRLVRPRRPLAAADTTPPARVPMGLPPAGIDVNEFHRDACAAYLCALFHRADGAHLRELASAVAHATYWLHAAEAESA